MIVLPIFAENLFLFLFPDLFALVLLLLPLLLRPRLFDEILRALEFASESGADEEYASSQSAQKLRLLTAHLLLHFRAFLLFSMLLLLCAMSHLLNVLRPHNFEHPSGHFEKLLRCKSIDVETEFDLLAVLPNVELVQFLRRLLVEFPVNLIEILIEELLLFGDEYFLKNLVDLLEMTHFYHAISLINHQVFEGLKINNLIFKQLMQSPGRSDDNLGLSLSDDPQLLLFRHSSDDAGQFDLVDWLLSSIYLL